MTGRIKDIIVRGGENISAGEVEQELKKIPGIFDVAVVGVKDPLMGERACACVINQEGHETTVQECYDWFESKQIAKFKIPEYVLNLEEFPLSAAGKISKPTLRKLAQATISNQQN